MKAIFSTLLATLLAALPGCKSSPASAINAKAPQSTGMSVQKFTLSDGSTHKCSVFLPFAYASRDKWPTIVFLQGLFEGGSDGVKNTTVGLGPAIKKRAATFDYIAIFPQSRGTWSSGKTQKFAIEMLDAAEAKYKIDRDRVFLTGMSTGGYGTWVIAANNPGRFAAIVPVCANSGEKFAGRLTDIPVWAFHNLGDPIVSSGNTKSTVKKINAAGGKALQTIYGRFGHNCWDRAYADPKLWDWLARQKRRGAQ